MCLNVDAPVWTYVMKCADAQANEKDNSPLHLAIVGGHESIANSLVLLCVCCLNDRFHTEQMWTVCTQMETASFTQLFCDAINSGLLI